jgi:hypothetical protein
MRECEATLIKKPLLRVIQQCRFLLFELLSGFTCAFAIFGLNLGIELGPAQPGQRGTGVERVGLGFGVGCVGHAGVTRLALCAT